MLRLIKYKFKNIIDKQEDTSKHLLINPINVSLDVYNSVRLGI